MEQTVLFVVGAPGVGKTTLVRELLGKNPYDGEIAYEPFLVSKPKWSIYRSKAGDHLACAAGHYTGGTFDGADTVPYNGVKEALEYWNSSLFLTPLTVFDGDRFSHQGVLNFFNKEVGGLRVRAVHLEAPEEVLVERRKVRGSNQNASWMKGRVTKAERFAHGLIHCRLFATRAPQELAKTVWDWLLGTASNANRFEE